MLMKNDEMYVQDGEGAAGDLRFLINRGHRCAIEREIYASVFFHGKFNTAP